MFTEVVLPDMRGSPLANGALACRPALKVLFTSGYIDDAILCHGSANATMDFAEKPDAAEAVRPCEVLVAKQPAQC